MLRKALDMDISLCRGPIGKTGGDLLAGTFDRKGQYEGKSLNNRNFILKCMEKYAQ